MLPGQPSRTALGAAAHRAVHQTLEGGRISADPLVGRLLGAEGEAAIRAAADDPSQRRLRLFIAVRSRFAEDALAAAIGRGVRQVVILGAGLDTYAYRAIPAENLRIFEVDHPATQAWKRQRLDAAGIAAPAALTFAPIDFERETLAAGLAAAGFDAAQRTFFTWLGVAPYLKRPAIFSTLAFIAGLPGGAAAVFDYGNPPAAGGSGEDDTADRRALAARVASVGEAIESYFETEALCAELTALGFCEIEDLGPALIRKRFFAGRGGDLSDRGGHIVRVATC